MSQEPARVEYPPNVQAAFAELNERQREVVNFGAGMACVVGNPGCLAGSAEIGYRRGWRVATRQILLEDLFLKFNGLRSHRRPWADLNEPAYTHSFGSDGVTYLNRIEAVLFSGVKPCVLVRAVTGETLACTVDHPFLLPDLTYAPAFELMQRHGKSGHGAAVLMLGSMRPVKGKGRRKPGGRPVIVDTKHHPYGWLHVVNAVERMRTPTAYSYRRVPRARLVLEAALNGVTYHEFVHVLNNDAQAAARFHYLDPTLHVHHLDENKTHDVPENLACATHSRLHGKVENFNVEYCRIVNIASVNEIGELPTFDIHMQGPDHNFAASRFFVHNSGKTKSVVARIARMANDGLDPQYILAMTFTRAAASEMNTRLEALGVQGARVGTIHSVSRQIAATETGLLQGRVDEQEKMTIELKKLLSDFRRRGAIPEFGVDFEGVRRYIEACKATGLCYIDGDPFGLNMLSEEFLRNRARYWHQLAGVKPDKLVHLYVELERRRASLSLYNFDDMQCWAWMALVADPEARRRWRERWSIVLVDESQDSSPVQWDMARILTGLETCVSGLNGQPFAPARDAGLHNLMTVGDSSQSLYSWRSAEPKLFVEYAKAPDVTTIVLDKNYRSNQTVCSVATGLVRGREWHLGGEIVSAADPDTTPKVITLKCFKSVEEEADAVVGRCLTLAQDSGLRSCAVLSRLRVGLDLMEIECIRRKIKYIKMSSGSFFSSREVRDILAYLRVAACLDPDGRWLRHVINKPFRYIGAAYISKAATWAQASNMSLMDGLMQLSDELNYKQRHALQKLYELLRRLNEIAATAEQHDQAARKAAELTAAEAPITRPAAGDILTVDDETLLQDEQMLDGPADMIGLVLRKTGYLEELRREEGLLGMDESRVAALAALQRMAHFFPTVAQFLTYVDALTVAVEQAAKSGLRVKEESRADALVLSTIHRMKGLEARHVFLVDVAAGRFPCAKSTNPDEELRLLYVAITRAKETCQVSYTGPDHDSDPNRIRSPFVYMIERELMALGHMKKK